MNRGRIKKHGGRAGGRQRAGGCRDQGRPERPPAGAPASATRLRLLTRRLLNQLGWPARQAGPQLQVLKGTFSSELELLAVCVAQGVQVGFHRLRWCRCESRGGRRAQGQRPARGAAGPRGAGAEGRARRNGIAAQQAQHETKERPHLVHRARAAAEDEHVGSRRRQVLPVWMDGGGEGGERRGRERSASTPAKHGTGQSTAAAHAKQPTTPLHEKKRKEGPPHLIMSAVTKPLPPAHPLGGVLST